MSQISHIGVNKIEKYELGRRVNVESCVADKTIVCLCQSVPPILLKVKVNLAYFLKTSELAVLMSDLQFCSAIYSSITLG